MLPKPLQVFSYHFPSTNIDDAIRDIVVYEGPLAEITHYLPTPII